MSAEARELLPVFARLSPGGAAVQRCLATAKRRGVDCALSQAGGDPGRLVSGQREGGRPVVFVHLSSVELLPNQASYATPVLFEPKLCATADDEFRLQGWEQTEEHAWVAHAGCCGSDMRDSWC